MSELLDQQPMPRKAKAKLNRLLASKQVTPEGVDWLVEYTDPFHDTPNKNAGLPVGLGTRTTRKWVRKQVTISKPASVTGDWELAITATPCTYLNQMESTPVTNYLVPSTYDGKNIPAPIVGSTARLYPGITANALEATGSLISSTVAQPFNQLSLDAGDYDSSGGSTGLKSGHMIVAMGFEAHNVSPELTKQGSVSYWRAPTCRSAPRSTKSSGVASSNTVVLDGLAVSAADLAADPDTVIEEAKEGGYVPNVMSRPEQATPRLPDVSTLVYMSSANGTTNCFAKNSAITAMAENVVEDWCFSGAWFTGLGADSKINVIAKYCIEEVVGIDDYAFPYASPSAPYDPEALSIASRLVNEMPYGCKVSENPLGEWFNSLMDSVAEYAPKVLGSVPVIGGALGTGVSLAAKAAGGINRSLASKPKKPHKAPNTNTNSVPSAAARADLIRDKRAQTQAKRGK